VTNFPSFPEKGELLTPKIIAIVGSSTAITGSGCGIVDGSDGLANLESRHPSKGDDLAIVGALGRLALQSFEHIKLRDLCLLDSAVAFRDCDLITNRDLAREDAADGQPPDVIAVIQIQLPATGDCPGESGAARVIVFHDVDSKSGCRLRDSSASCFFAVPSRDTA